MIQSILPTLVYRDNLASSLDNDYLYRKALDLSETTQVVNKWDSGMYNSLEVTDITQDKEVKRLIDLCRLHISKFALEFGVKREIHCSDCWFNVYKPGDYQEFHTHPLQHFSAVYYVKVPRGSGSLVLSGPDNMYPLPSPNFESQFEIDPEESDLVIFRSNILHRVSRNKTDQIRVSIAMNFRY